jgi:K+-sensing histidine kinase KdpD
MRGSGRARGFVVAFAAVAAVTIVIGAIETRIHIGSIAMLYLIAVLASATLDGRRAAVAASLASFLAYNWFFVEPLHTFQVGDQEEWFALVLFLVTAGITGQLASQLRDRARESAERAQETVALYEERERLREQATEAEVLRRADELKTVLLGAVSHDLRTPLSSIIASAGSLRQPDVEWTAAERDGFLADIESEARRLARIVANLLDLSRMESGTLRPERGWYDFGALVDDVLGRLRPLTGGREITLDVADDLPPVPLDYVEIDQVLSNIIENAIGHTPPGTRIWIAAERNGDQLAVTIADDGPGIADDARGRLFDPFVRSGDRRGSPRGAGLGLAIARGLVEAHGGRIDAAPRSGGGTAISFTLPLREPAAIEVGAR